MLKLMYITNDPQVALIAEKAGVDRIWIDLETLGKEERQKNFDTVKSHHTVNDIKRIRPLLSASELLVRIDPWHADSPTQINAVIGAGAQIVMLPYWKTVSEVQNFIDAVDHRARTMLLLETKEAVECLDEALKISGIDEIRV
jgi:2-keto-3-deoxy-L-rhamnonate aldolase RhmA